MVADGDSPMRIFSVIVLLVLLGLGAGLLIAVPRPITAAPVRPPLTELKDAIWPQRAPLAPATLLSPGRLLEIDKLSLSAQSNPGPTPTDVWTYIAFQAGEAQRWDVWVIPAYYPAEYNAIRLTHDAAIDVLPTLNFDGSLAAFVSLRDGNEEIYRTDVNETLPQYRTLQRLTRDPAADRDPAWAPHRDLIAFVRVVDGQGEIFRMNADGSGLIRLTNHPANDFSPYWSPDGRQILWARQQGNSAALWVMHADGTGQRAISVALPYLQNPRWSPKGDLIAFDYDADGDGMNELAVIRPDGSGLRTVFDAGTDLVELWVGDWAPRADRIAFTVILYTIVDARLAVQDALLGWYNLEQQSIYAFDVAPNKLEALPIWRLRDHLPPVTRLNPLPAESPASFQVSWQGEDRGISGIEYFEVQVRDGAQGEWSLWEQLPYYVWSSTFSGLGGRTYSFRVRAWDRAGNAEPWPSSWQAMTTVENQPPQSRLRPLQPYERNGVYLHWSGEDRGGSDILGFDVQYRRDGEIGWRTWFTRTQQTSARFSGETGTRYYFRVRAVDTAYNTEPWREGDGDTGTTLYGWKLTGTVTDIRGGAIKDLHPLTVPAGFVSYPTNARGEFAVYGHETVDPILAFWQKPGYGEPAPVRFLPAQDRRIHVVLPPLDDRVRNGDFEDGIGTSTWSLSPQARDAVRTTSVAHMGDAALAMGCQIEPLTPSEAIPLTDNSGDPGITQFLIDKNENFHILRKVYPHNIMYIYRNSSGLLITEKIFNETKDIHQGIMILDNYNNPHIILTDHHDIIHLTRLPTGVWTQHNIYSIIHLPNIKIDVDSKNIIHIVFSHTNRLYYLNRQPDGTWSSLQVIINLDYNYYYDIYKIIIDDKDTIHLFLKAHDNKLIYIRRLSNGNWTQRESIEFAHNISITDVLIDKDDNVHFLLRRENELLYTFRDYNGIISGITRIDTDYPVYFIYNDDARMAISKNNHVYIIWRHLDVDNNLVFYIRKKQDQTWTSSIKLPYKNYDLQNMFLDQNEVIHLIMKSNTNSHIYYAQTDMMENWQNEIRVFNVDTWNFSLKTAHNKYLHFLMIPLDAGGGMHYARTRYQDWPAQTYTLSQSIKIPDASAQPTLSLFYRLQPAPGLRPTRWQVALTTATGTTTPITANTRTDEWQHAWADLTPWAGQTVTLSLRLEQPAASLCAQAHVDDVVVGPMRYPDLWVTAPALTPSPGEEIPLRLFYGNEGQALAPGTQLTLSLPLSLTLVTADPPPSATPNDHTWRWNVGDLAPQRQALPVTVMVTAPTLPEAGTVLTGTVHIGAEAIEPVYANNDRYVRIFVEGKTLYFPQVVRSH